MAGRTFFSRTSVPNRLFVNDQTNFGWHLRRARRQGSANATPAPLSVSQMSMRMAISICSLRTKIPTTCCLLTGWQEKCAAHFAGRCAQQPRRYRREIRLFDAARYDRAHWRCREIGGGGGYLSIGESPQHFGVDPQKRSATIRFPSGQTEKNWIITAGQSVQLAEQKGIRKQFTRTLDGISRLVRYSFWVNVLLFWCGWAASPEFFAVHPAISLAKNANRAIFGGNDASGCLLFCCWTARRRTQVLLWQILALLVVGLVLGAFRRKFSGWSGGVLAIENCWNLFRKLILLNITTSFLRNWPPLFNSRWTCNIAHCWNLCREKNTAEIRAAAGDWSSSGFPLRCRSICENDRGSAGSRKPVICQSVAGVATVAAKLVVPITRQSGFWCADAARRPSRWAAAGRRGFRDVANFWHVSCHRHRKQPLYWVESQQLIQNSPNRKSGTIHQRAGK